MARPIAGIFVGGEATRMGGHPKGLLPGPDGRPLITRLAAIAAPLADVVLVGDRPEYAGLGLPTVADEPRGIGPLGGLLALLRHAGSGHVLAIACDMPRVPRRLVEALVGAPAAPIVAPRLEGRWEPLCARYEVARALPAAEERARGGQLSLQGLLDAVGAVALAADAYAAVELEDWDLPDDIR